MPLGDSSLHPILMTPIQIIRPSSLVEGVLAVGLVEGMEDPFIGEVITGIPNSYTQDSEDGVSNMIIQGLIMRLELLESSNLALWTEVNELANTVAKIVLENISLKKQQSDNKEQDALHHPGDTLHAKILDL